MKTKFRYILVLITLFVFALVGCDHQVPEEKLIIGIISYDETQNIIYWQQTQNAIGYELTITGEGTTHDVNEFIEDDNYNQTTLRYEYKHVNGVNGKQFTIKVVAIGDGKHYASSNPTTARFTCNLTEEIPIIVKLELGLISYDTKTNIIHWKKVDNAINYQLTVSGEGVSSTINKTIGDSNYNQTKKRYEFKITNGINEKQFTVKLTALADGIYYLNSDQSSIDFTYIEQKVENEKEQLVLGEIAYDSDKSIVYWLKVENAIGYQLIISGAGVSKEINTIISNVDYNNITQRFEYKISNGIDEKQFTVKLIALANGVSHTDSNQATSLFTYLVVNKPLEQLVLGEIGYDEAQNIIYWQKVDNAINYSLRLSGIGVSQETNQTINNSSFNQTTSRFEVVITNGIDGQIFNVSLKAVADEINYTSSTLILKSFTCVNEEPEPDPDPTPVEKGQNAEGYYYYSADGFGAGEYYNAAYMKSGSDLANTLKTILSNGFTKVSYADVRYILEKADLNPDDDFNTVRGMYNQNKIANYWIGKGPGAWQREHVWPNSKLGVADVKDYTKNQASDVHNLRGIDGINQTRSNRYFEDGSGAAKTIGSDAFYPSDTDKGDVARILFYMAIMYSDVLTLTDDTSKLVSDKNTNHTPAGAYMGKLSVLLKWHKEDPVDEFEILRNEYIYDGKATGTGGSPNISPQGNRNPFIDKPELAHLIFEGKTISELTEVNTNGIKAQTVIYIEVNLYIPSKQEFIF